MKSSDYRREQITVAKQGRMMISLSHDLDYLPFFLWDFFTLRATGLTKNILGVGQECGHGE